MEHWDGTETMPFVVDDGGRADAGYKGQTGDCVCRSIAIATGKPELVLKVKQACIEGIRRKNSFWKN